MGFGSRKHAHDLIPYYRLMLIDRAVKEFREAFSIMGVPVNCIEIAKTLNRNPRILRDRRIYVTDTKDLSPRVYARTVSLRRDENELVYFVFLNSTQLVDPESNHARWKMERSRDRMVNFTLAHEFGHIMLDHAEIPDSLKRLEIIHEEDLEANEFAGQLLMPAYIFENNEYSSLSQAASELLVSESAIKNRISQLRKKQRPREDSF